MRVHVNADVEVDAYDVLTDISLKELAEIVAARREVEKVKTIDPTDPVQNVIDEIDLAAFEEAMWHWSAGRSSDALYFLEKALGRSWAGLSELGFRVAS